MSISRTVCLIAAMLAATGAVSADDKPATAKKPPVVVTDGAAGGAGEMKKPPVVVTDGAAGGAGEMLYETMNMSSTRKLGVAVTPADPVLRANVPATKGTLGLVVTSVVKDSPAAKAKILANDIILELAGKELSTVSDLTVAVQKAKSPANVALLRGGKTITVWVRFPDPTKVARTMAGMYDLVVGYDTGSKYTIGAGTKPVDLSLASQLVLPPNTGLVVTSVANDGPAAKAGLKRHDVILAVADAYIASETHLGKILDKADGRSVKLDFLRAGRKHSGMIKATKRSPVDYRLWSLRDLKLADYDKMRTDWRVSVERMYGTKPPASDLNTQVDRLAKQVDELKKTLEALKQQLPARKTKVRKIKSK
jgi:C-terminal processing protease CtpA/Prc